MDADLQDPPYLIREMIAAWEKGFQDVYARRKERRGETYLKKSTSKLFYRILSLVSDVAVQKDTGDFRLLDKKAFKALQQIPESQRYTKGLFSYIGFNKKEILFDRDPRRSGETKWNYRALIELAIEGVTSSSTIPLRISTIVGSIVSLSAFLLMIKVLVKTIFFEEQVQGYASMMIAILFLGGFQLLSLGLLGEYLGRGF